MHNLPQSSCNRARGNRRNSTTEDKMDSAANSSLSLDFDNCVSSVATRYLFTAWFSVYLLFLPVFLFVLYVGFNKWKKPQSSASGGLSHSDVFTLHMVAMEMASVIGSCIFLYGYCNFNIELSKVGGNTVLTTSTAQVLFHSLTCVERYLAVVHPVTYLRLRREGGVTIRNISIALVWVMSVGYSLLISIVNTPVLYGIVGFVSSIAPFTLVAYCSVYVLCVLIRPKPGDGGGLRKHIDQSKRTTVYTMVAILAALLLRLIVDVVINCINFLFWQIADVCVMNVASLWAALPSGLVLPVLFLHRAGKLSTTGK